jgi:histone-lysine N-methyltransferase SETD1
MTDVQEPIREKESKKRHTNGKPGVVAPKEDAGGASKISRKRPSPFRIKVGCVVALRNKPEGMTVSKVSSDGTTTSIFPDDELIPVWTSPIKGRDEGLTLVGKRVRCFLPKRLVEGKKRRVLEGEVVGVWDYMTRSEGKPWKIDLLVDTAVLADFPFLVRTDEEVDIPSLPTDRARRNHRLEATIRGADKLSVRVRLSQPGSAETKNALKWVIQKVVPKKLWQRSSTNGSKMMGKRKSNESESAEKSTVVSNGTTAAPLENKESVTPKKKRKVDTNAVKHVGDREDTPEQQIANWRWLVSRYHDTLLRSDNLRQNATEAALFSAGFIGEVMKVESMPKGSSSLATVVVRKMVLPELTVSGISPENSRADLYDDHDFARDIFRIPVEEVVVVARKVHRRTLSEVDQPDEVDEETDINVSSFACRWTYFIEQNAYLSLPSDNAWTSEKKVKLLPCHRCRRPVDHGKAPVGSRYEESPVAEIESRVMFCADCDRLLRTLEPYPSPGASMEPGGMMNSCECSSCRVQSSDDLCLSLMPPTEDSGGKDHSIQAILQIASGTASTLQYIGFGLPENMLTFSGAPVPSSKPMNRPKGTGQKLSIAKAVNGKKKNGKVLSKGEQTKDRATDLAEAEPPEGEEEEMNVFKPTCARLLVYETIRAGQKTFQSSPASKTDRPRNLREQQIQAAAAMDTDGKTTQRAARAKQRRLVKGIAGSNLDLDTLATRESQLRFDRSSIHAWGVFADGDISSGDMIVEYRGEIIENAMTEKREKLYETAKIGSDYMFRIDSHYVCDATKVGNVARFINASCDPNCYTKIITVDGQKRIVVYAKKDIPEGEELCYDYKFPLEYNPAKRIPCQCGAQNCRGFMNWDKKYIVVTNAGEQMTSTDEGTGMTAPKG